MVALDELKALSYDDLLSFLEAMDAEDRNALADELGVNRGRNLSKRLADAIAGAAASGVRAAEEEDPRVRAELLTWEIVQRDPGFLNTASASDLADYLSYLKTTQFESAADRKTFEEWKA